MYKQIHITKGSAMNICILIVDDDRLVVDKIVEGVEWARLGIDPVLTAQNIRQAKDILEEVPVDILLSDIEMPQGSGLELLEWVRDRKMQLDCIFLSSYAHFAYAQKAINLKTSEYLLKPASNREIEDALTGVVEEIRKRKSGKEEDREKAFFWEQYLSIEDMDDATLEKAQTAGFYEPERLVCLQLMRVYSESLGRHRKEITLSFLIQRVTGEFLQQNDKGGAVIGFSPPQ